AEASGLAEELFLFGPQLQPDDVGSGTRRTARIAGRHRTAALARHVLRRLVFSAWSTRSAVASIRPWAWGLFKPLLQRVLRYLPHGHTIGRRDIGTVGILAAAWQLLRNIESHDCASPPSPCCATSGENSITACAATGSTTSAGFWPTTRRTS